MFKSRLYPVINLIVLGLPALVLSSCSQPAPVLPATELTALPTQTAFITPPPPITETPVPTWTYTFTPVPTRTLTPTQTVTQLPTSTSTPAPFRFAVIGDYGLEGDPARQVADMIDGWNVDFIITTGDNNYPEGAAETIDVNIGQYYGSYIFPYQGSFGEGAASNRFFPSLGNHDYLTLEARPYFDYFTLPGNERYYDFTWGSIHFFVLNSNGNEPDGVGRSSQQGVWLREQLAASSSPWKIVYMHHPPYSSGYHGSIDWMRWPFQEWGASAVISGHDHTYERLEIDQLPYFINGLGGGARYPFNEPIPGSQVRFRDDYGAMLVTATENQITFEFITISGFTIDTHTMLTNSGQP